MKRLVTLLAVLLSAVASYASGGVMVVDTERIFKSIDAYNSALVQIEGLSKEYQQQVDEKFQRVEAAFESYSNERSQLTAQQRSDREKMILVQEKMATNFQEEHFSKDGTLMKRRVELISPIQSRVFGAIEAYAEANGYDVVIDKSANSTLLYSRDSVDKTDEIIENLNKN